MVKEIRSFRDIEGKTFGENDPIEYLSYEVLKYLFSP